MLTMDTGESNYSASTYTCTIKPYYIVVVCGFDCFPFFACVLCFVMQYKVKRIENGIGY